MNEDLEIGKQKNSPLEDIESQHAQTEVSACSICLADYNNGDIITYSSTGQCNHTYHKDCIIQWLVIGHNSCPTCRNEFIKYDANEETLATR